MKKILVSIGIFGLVMILLYFFKSKTEQVNPKELSTNKQPEVVKKDLATVSLTPDIASKPLHIRYHQCRPLLDALAKNKDVWKKEIDSLLVAYLDDYDDVNITRALVLLEGGFFAYRKRGILRVPDKNLSTSQKKMNSIFLEAIGVEVPNGIGFSRSVENLQSHFEQPEEERKSNIARIGLLVDDVVTAIRSDDFSNQQIIELMLSLVDINGFTHDTANYRPDNLLDAIVDAKNEELFDAYIELKGKVSNKYLGVNPLERLISNYRSKDAPLPQGLINKLVEFRLPIRVNKSTNSKGEAIELGAFWTHSVRDIEYFEELVLNQNLTVTDAPKKDSLREMPDVKEILARLKKDKFASGRSELSGINQQDIEVCQTARYAVWNATNRDDAFAKISEAKELFGDDQISIIGYLSEFENSLVDCYLSSKNHFKRTVPSNSKDFDEFYRKITKGNIYQGIQDFNYSGKDSNQKAYLFWQLVGTDPALASPLVESGIVPQRNDFFWAADVLDAESYSAIEKLGFSFDHKSPNGKSLTEYAAKQCNADLISGLYQLQQPYSHQTMGNDALSYALTTSSCKNEKARLVVISAVMNFEPTIKKSHKQDIADLRLKEYDTYKSMIDIYPQLEIADDVRGSQYSCL